MIAPLPDILLRPLVERALAEDLGRAGDITSNALIPPTQPARAVLVARRAGVLAGLDLARLTFALADPMVLFTARRADGAPLAAGETIAELSGPARSLLLAERVALNFLTHLSGVATATAAMVAAVAGTGARIACTRKTLPGLRPLQKHAVRCGGGFNHRLGLDDAVLIKDNHLAALAGDIGLAVSRARAAVGHLVAIEVEIDGLAQLPAALAAGADAILCDNFSLADLQAAVAEAAGRTILEASGGVTPENIRAVAATGVAVISSGWLTHSAPALDIALDFIA